MLGVEIKNNEKASRMEYNVGESGVTGEGFVGYFEMLIVLFSR